MGHSYHSSFVIGVFSFFNLHSMLPALPASEEAFSNGSNPYLSMRMSRNSACAEASLPGSCLARGVGSSPEPLIAGLKHSLKHNALCGQHPHPGESL